MVLRQPDLRAAVVRYLGVSLGHATDREAEHWLGSLDLPVGVEACTHLTRTPYPHVAISVAVPEGARLALPPVAADLTAASGEAAAAHAAGRSGRAVLFRGVGFLLGTVTVAEVLAHTAIGRVTVLGGGSAEPDRLLVTRDFVRPQWTDGVLALVTMPAIDGQLVPFEVPDPTPCCADHH
ncbi:hypothetical protein K1W54_24695 [Micromonospora sp. CPCC 205371]|nr:hypothetical protein [Micromonospora sp. CPCC 205371]